MAADGKHGFSRIALAITVLGLVLTLAGLARAGAPDPSAPASTASAMSSISAARTPGAGSSPSTGTSSAFDASAGLRTATGGVTPAAGSTPTAQPDAPARGPLCGPDGGAVADAVDRAKPGVPVALPPGCYLVSVPVVVPDHGSEVRVEGPGVTLEGKDSVFEVPAGASLVLHGLVISGSGDSAIVNRGHLRVNATTFTKNDSQGDGGAIDNHFGDVRVDGSTFAGNTSANEFSGGAIATQGGTVRISNSTFAENASGSDGGAIDNQDGALTVASSTFFRNSAPGSGGAVESDQSGPDDPSAVDGGGATLRNSLFYGNKALVGDGVASIGAMANLDHSIVAGSGDGGCAFVAGANNLSDVKGSRCGDIAVDVGLGRVGALADNGGITQTVALLSGNPAIDGGECSGSDETGLDQREFPRPRSPLNPCDVGAYEANRISVDDVVVKEGDGACTRLDFTMELDAVPLDDVAVTPRVSGGQECDPGGIAARRADRVTFGPGEDAATVTTGSRADERFAPSRRVFLELVDAVNAVPRPGGRRAMATIVNDDENQAPSASDHAVATYVGAPPIAIDLSDLVDDAETADSALTYRLVENGPQKGTAELSGSVLTYEVHDAVPGTDVLTYRVTDEGDPRCGGKSCEPARSASATITITILEGSSPVPSAGATTDPLVAPSGPSHPTSSPTGPLSRGDGSPLPGAEVRPSGTRAGARPDLALEDTALRLVREANAAGSGGDVVYALGTGPVVLSASGDSLRLTTTVLNHGDGGSPPTSITVASPGWTGRGVAVPPVPAHSEVAIDELMTAPAGVSGDTKFVVTIAMVEGELDPTNNAEPGVVAAVDDGDDLSSSLLALVLLAGVVAAAAVVTTTTLLRRRPSVRSAQRSEDDRRAGGARGPGLTDLADQCLGTAPGASLSLAGPACAWLREAIGDSRRADPVIATLFWRAVIATPGFARSLAALGASAGAIDRPDMLVVSHAGGTRHDLVVLDPDFAQPEPSSTVVDVSPEELAGVWETLTDGLRGAVGRWPTRKLMEVVAEAAHFERFGLVVAPKPQLVLTRCPSPAWPVGEGEGVATSSAGAVVVDASGRKGVTVADHAVRGHEKVIVNGCIGTVVSSDAISDSSFVEVDVVSTGVFRGEKGPLSGVSPRQMEVVEFDGVRSGRTTTRVVGWDPSILTMDSYIQNKIVTEPVTVQGDSGAALVDAEGHVLGFAFYTTGLNAHPAHSGWIWADSVYRAHGLTPLIEE